RSSNVPVPQAPRKHRMRARGAAGGSAGQRLLRQALGVRVDVLDQRRGVETAEVVIDELLQLGVDEGGRGKVDSLGLGTGEREPDVFVHESRGEAGLEVVLRRGGL